jgi:hypothetical protein
MRAYAGWDSPEFPAGETKTLNKRNAWSVSHANCVIIGGFGSRVNSGFPVLLCKTKYARNCILEERLWQLRRFQQDRLGSNLHRCAGPELGNIAGYVAILDITSRGK